MLEGQVSGPRVAIGATRRAPMEPTDARCAIEAYDRCSRAPPEPPDAASAIYLRDAAAVARCRRAGASRFPDVAIGRAQHARSDGADAARRRGTVLPDAHPRRGGYRPDASRRSGGPSRRERRSRSRAACSAPMASRSAGAKVELWQCDATRPLPPRRRRSRDARRELPGLWRRDDRYRGPLRVSDDPSGALRRTPAASALQARARARAAAHDADLSARRIAERAWGSGCRAARRARGWSSR